MFCAFDGPARIVRLSGRARVTTCDEPGFDELAEPFAALTGARSVISVDVDRVSDSCGYGVPRHGARRAARPPAHVGKIAGRHGTARLPAPNGTGCSIDGLTGF